MEMIKNVVALIGIVLIILDVILTCYGIIMNNDRQKRIAILIGQILQIFMLYGGYRMISFFNS